MTTDWVKSLKTDYTTTVKGMMTDGKNFIHKQSEKYETGNLRTPFRIVALMFNRVVGLWKNI